MCPDLLDAPTVGMMRRLVSTLAVAACCANTMELRVATHVGSRFLDKKVDLSVDGASCTIGDIKDLVRAKFPGAPPASVQRLFLGSRLLRDEDLAGSLAEDDEDDGAAADDDSGCAAAGRKSSA